MPEAITSNLLENKILEQITEINYKIAELEEEKRVLNRLLLKARRSSSIKDVTRKNSVDRIFIESKILEIINSQKSSVMGSYIYKELKLLDFSLKDSTFRSYLHRLQEKGLIAPDKRGYWRLPQER